MYGEKEKKKTKSSDWHHFEQLSLWHEMAGMYLVLAEEKVVYDLQYIFNFPDEIIK